MAFDLDRFAGIPALTRSVGSRALRPSSRDVVSLRNCSCSDCAVRGSSRAERSSRAKPVFSALKVLTCKPADRASHVQLTNIALVAQMCESNNRPKSEESEDAFRIASDLSNLGDNHVREIFSRGALRHDRNGRSAGSESSMALQACEMACWLCARGRNGRHGAHHERAHEPGSRAASGHRKQARGQHDDRG